MGGRALFPIAVLLVIALAAAAGGAGPGVQ
jgi:hypothetical protein